MLVLLLLLALVLLLLAAWLLAWSCLRGPNSLKRRALQLDRGDLMIDEMMKYMRQWNCKRCAGPIEKDLICCFLATGFPTHYLLLTSFFYSTLAYSLGVVQNPDASSACCIQL